MRPGHNHYQERVVRLGPIAQEQLDLIEHQRPRLRYGTKMSPLTTGGKSVALQQSEPRRLTNIPHYGNNPAGRTRGFTDWGLAPRRFRARGSPRRCVVAEPNVPLRTGGVWVAGLKRIACFSTASVAPCTFGNPRRPARSSQKNLPAPSKVDRSGQKPQIRDD